MKISIITVCYNSGKTIEKTLNSILLQSFQNYEYIIIDGNSTDDTLSIVRKYEPKFEGKMRIYSEKDNGIYDAMNKGIRLAQGELIGIVNSDDWLERDALDKIIKNYSGNLYEVVYGMQRGILDGKEYEVIIKRHEFLERKMITHPTCFVTKKTYEDFGLFSLEYKSSADYEFMLRLFESQQVIFTPVYHIISNFVLGGISSSNLGVIETAKIKKKYGIISTKKYLITLLKAKFSDIIGNNYKTR